MGSRSLRQDCTPINHSSFAAHSLKRGLQCAAKPSDRHLSVWKHVSCLKRRNPAAPPRSLPQVSVSSLYIYLQCKSLPSQSSSSSIFCQHIHYLSRILASISLEPKILAVREYVTTFIVPQSWAPKPVPISVRLWRRQCPCFAPHFRHLWPYQMTLKFMSTGVLSSTTTLSGNFFCQHVYMYLSQILAALQ